MSAFKKYSAIALFSLVYPLIGWLGTYFVKEAKTVPYAYVPQGSDVIIELTPLHFAKEWLYQRLFNEHYALDRLKWEEEDVKKITSSGMDPLSKVLLCRYPWEGSTAWMGIVGVDSPERFTAFVQEQLGDVPLVFTPRHAIVQLFPSEDRASSEAYLQRIARKDLPSIVSQVDLSAFFVPQKYIHCYFAFPLSQTPSPFAEGYLNVDFTAHQLVVNGTLNTTPEFTMPPPIAYAIDDKKALSLRTSLGNLTDYVTDPFPERALTYRQLALDYNQVQLSLTDRNAMPSGMPFSLSLDMQAHLDVDQGAEWQSLMDTLVAQKKIARDTAQRLIVTQQGIPLHYAIDHHSVELSSGDVVLNEGTAADVLLDFRLAVNPLLDGVVVDTDESNPPSALEQSIGRQIIQKIRDELRALEAIETLRLQLKRGGKGNLTAAVEVQFKHREGHAAIESASLLRTFAPYAKALR